MSSISCLETPRKSRIVGGVTAEKGEAPYIVSLTRRGGHFCGATILNANWIVTAGHCVCNGLNKIMKPSQIKGIVGLHQISNYRQNDNSDEDPYEVQFKNIVPHPEYGCTKVANDIALLQLSQPLKFSKHIQPTCVALDDNDLYEDTVGIVSGWGWTHENQDIGDRADILQKASVKVWNNERCQRSFEANGMKNTITQSQMCAGHETGGIDSCWADSGGPLVTASNTLIGIVSTGIGCARPGLPGIYTRVTKYTDWIESVIFNKF